jgi:transcriptional regulator with XRE-family HTH domain
LRAWKEAAVSARLSDINSLFIVALRRLLDQLPRGSKRRLAEHIGVSTGHFSDILKGRRGTSEEQRRRLAEVLGYPGARYDDFLALGQALRAAEDGPDQSPDPKEGIWSPDDPAGLRLAEPGWDEGRSHFPAGSRVAARQRACPPSVPDSALRAPDGSPLHFLGGDEMRERGFLVIPFSEEMKLAAGRGGTIPITEDVATSPVIVHGPTLGLRSSKHLQAFRVGGDSMEPLIAQNGIILADVSRNDLQHLQEGAIYVLCWDLDEGECAVKRLRWAEKGHLLLIESEDRFYPPVVKRVQEVILIGQVIWAWREFKYR